MRNFVVLLCFIGLLFSCGSSKTRFSNTIHRQSSGDFNYSGNKIAKGDYRHAQTNDHAKADSSNFDYEIHPEAAQVKTLPANKQMARAIVDYAKTYLGTGYRYGGMSSNGIDCSGLIYLSFLNVADIELPRRSRDIAQKGKPVTKGQMKPGDLIFFKTNGARAVNHIGIVVENGTDGPQFIHSSTSRGVMISGLNEQYWTRAYQGARRIL